MAKISSELEQQLRAMPHRTVNLIVRTAGDVSPHLNWLTSAGFEVKQQYKLSPGVAVSCTGQTALKLLGQDWVVSIELDEPVHTMGR